MNTAGAMAGKILCQAKREGLYSVDVVLQNLILNNDPYDIKDMAYQMCWRTIGGIFGGQLMAINLSLILLTNPLLNVPQTFRNE